MPPRITTDPAVVGQREDAIGQAAGQQGGNRQAALDAIATGGRAGRQAYRDGQQSVNAARNQAMSGMTADSYGVLNTPGSDITQATQQIGGQTYDAYRGALGRLGEAFGRNMDAQGALNSNYFTQIAASAPAYRQMANEQIDEARRQWLAQKAAFDAAQQESGAGSMSKWEIEANASGLGQEMAGQAVQGGKDLKRENKQSATEHDALTAEVQMFQDHFGRPPSRDEYDRLRQDVSARLYEGDRQEARRQRFAFDEGQQQVRDARATPDWAWQRAAAEAMGVPEHLAAGLFMPPDAGEVVNQAQEQRQLDYLTGPGGGQFESPQAMRDYGNAQNDLMRPPDPLPAATVADQMGLPPDEAAALMAHPAFGDAVDTFAQGVAGGMPIEQINADLAAWYDEQRDYGHDFPLIRQMVTMMYGHLAG
jgi:hypothetical protein